MAKISLAGFKDPVRRPRYIVWTGVIVLALAAFVVVALGATSTRWFCAGICHKVQDDAIAAYENSSHSEISCMACHEPVNADPVTLVLKKAKALGELYLTVTNNYSLPLNAESELSLNASEMPSSQCTQCHSANRKITPSAGIIIDHKVHADKGITCTTCHNRVAHNEQGLTLKLTNQKHPDYMTMQGCFRCHSLAKGAQAPGACSVCHTADFPLKPANHNAADFFPKGHAALADSYYTEEVKGAAEASKTAPVVEGGITVTPFKQVAYCSMCHDEKAFCEACHGMPIPHTTDFKTKSHPAVAKTSLAKCVMCHGDNATTHFCDDCHHGTQVGGKFDPTTPWINQHATVVDKSGLDSCLKQCHTTQFCSDCHTRLKPFPTSHQAATWLHSPSGADSRSADKTPAAHTVAAKNIQTCQICHGPGDAKTNPFCMGCHQLAMPHPAEFKQFHGTTGSANPKLCANCHTFKELCSNCHHVGSSPAVPWINQHPASIAANGTAGCFKTCHQDKTFCVTCHTQNKVLPASHKAANWLHATDANGAGHSAAYNKQKDSCSYCHGDGDPSTNAFCMGCHKIPMPHPSGFGSKTLPGGQHAADFKATPAKLDRAVCANCHARPFCDACHHNYTGPTPWLQQHPNVVKAGNPQDCFKCHAETYCSYCHVRLIH
jgi:nitrate/TMAO reductase-like tetraheme cytochrome c subunit